MRVDLDLQGLEEIVDPESGTSYQSQWEKRTWRSNSRDRKLHPGQTEPLQTECPGGVDLGLSSDTKLNVRLSPGRPSGPSWALVLMGSKVLKESG